MTDRLLRLMGPPRLSVIESDGTQTPQHLPPASLALLSLVALQGAGGMARAVVAEALWPDAAPEKSGPRLSSALWRSHDAAGRPMLDSSAGQIVLAPAARITVDVLDLAQHTAALRRHPVADWQACDVAALETALDRRAGGFLDGMKGDWVTASRQRCADIYEAGLEALIRYHRHCGDVDGSIAAARQLVRHDPYREDMQAVLVELYGLRGQPGRAMSQFASARDLLRSELGVDPGKALTRSLSGALERPSSASKEIAEHEVLKRLRDLDENVNRLARQIAELRSLLGADSRAAVK